MHNGHTRIEIINGATYSRPLVVGLGGTLRADSASRWLLERALATAEAAGARTVLLDLAQLDLPMYLPDKPLAAYGSDVAALIEQCRAADAMIWSTAAYHGALAGVTKNALDYLEFLAHDEQPYLTGRTVGIIATAGGDMAAVNAANNMVQIAHALRASVVPLQIAMPQAWRHVKPASGELDAKWESRLKSMAQMVVEAAQRTRSVDLLH